MTIDQRIKRLEKATGYVKGRVPGTQLIRTLTPTSIEWCLALGLMQQQQKPMFSGKTIEMCLKKAEKELL